MCRFVETVRIVDGRVCRLELHQARLDDTMRRIGASGRGVCLDEALAERPCCGGVMKARVVYGPDGVEEVGYAPYIMRSVCTLRIVCDNDIEYGFKYADRSSIDRLFAMRAGCDDVLIVRRGMITDTSFTNVALYDGARWVTPRLPLLHGTMRRYLLGRGVIEERDIACCEIGNYVKVALFNAMIDFGAVVVSTADVLR